MHPNETSAGRWVVRNSAVGWAPLPYLAPLQSTAAAVAAVPLHVAGVQAWRSPLGTEASTSFTIRKQLCG